MAQSEAVGIALLFSDYLVEEKNSSKKTVAGIFSVIYGRKFPLQYGPFWLYCSFTNLVGEHTFAINIHADMTKNVVLSVGGKVDSSDREAVIELSIPIQSLLLPEPEKYGVILHLDGSPLLNRTLYVRELKG